jgi:hypothetical protein
MNEDKNKDIFIPDEFVVDFSKSEDELLEKLGCCAKESREKLEGPGL